MRTHSMLAIGVLSLVAWTSPSLAQVIVPASATVPDGVDAPTMTLDMNGQEADTNLVHFYRRYYRPAFRYSYRPYYSYSYRSYRPYYGYSYRYYGGYYPRYSYRYSYSYYPRYYYPRSYYYYSGFCADDADTSFPTVNLGELPAVPQVTTPEITGNQLQPLPAPRTVPAPTQKEKDEFRYDGGPQNPVPVPAAPKQTKPAQPGGILVSLPGNKTSGPIYRAYGERFSNEPRTQKETTPSGFGYRAYGETTTSSGFASDR
ncbi:MAG: hypothetical protein ACFCD0_16000 [Gemmataceae bacterium]